MSKKKRVFLAYLTGFLTLISITLGVSYSFFSYIKEAGTENSVELGSITFKYTEVSGIGNGINIEDAFPLSDEEGKVQTGSGKVFDFKVESSLSRSDLEYEIVAEINEDFKLPLDAIKFYLTDITNGTEEEISNSINGEGKVKTLDEYEDTLIEIANGKTIYQETILRNTKGYVKNFRARMWISEDLEWLDETYVGKTAVVKVNVYAI